MKKQHKMIYVFIFIIILLVVILFVPFLERPKYKHVKVDSSVWDKVEDGTQRVSLYKEFIRDYLPRKPLETPPQLFLP